jgi:hypothetical protein
MIRNVPVCHIENVSQNVLGYDSEVVISIILSNGMITKELIVYYA